MLTTNQDLILITQSTPQFRPPYTMIYMPSEIFPCQKLEIMFPLPNWKKNNLKLTGLTTMADKLIFLILTKIRIFQDLLEKCLELSTFLGPADPWLQLRAFQWNKVHMGNRCIFCEVCAFANKSPFGLSYFQILLCRKKGNHIPIASQVLIGSSWR